MRCTLASNIKNAYWLLLDKTLLCFNPFAKVNKRIKKVSDAKWVVTEDEEVIK